jgi:toxin ParE1/3/4
LDVYRQGPRAIGSPVFVRGEKMARRLVEFPELGARYEIDHPELTDLRVFPIPRFKNYLMFYRIREDEIDVVRIIHGARDIPAILEGQI